MRSVPTHDQSFCRHFSPLLRGRRWLLLLCVVLNWGALSGQISFAEPTELTTDQNLAPQSSPTGALTEFVSTQGTLFLKDGRELEGQLAGVTDYQVNWTVATGQTISFPLTMVQRLEMGSAPEEKEKSDQTTSPLTPPEEVFPTPSNSGLIEPSGLEEAVPEPIALSDEELEAGSTGEAPASEEPAE
ncbi:MAG: hypothetical protein KDA65_01305, partial [Planctomycetaceae bacterium]|nr:hypothetical protein [Planctomycetaceae bacterium]